MKYNVSVLLSFFLLICTKIYANLTREEKNALLDLHKTARDAVYAPDMKELSWDDEIAKGAQDYSDKCLGMIHSDFSGGENLAGNTNHDVSQMFNQWMNEKAAFDESGYRAKFLDVSYNGKVVGHYSQIVWAKNSKLGCGLSYCEKLSYKNLLVCRYETGNYLNQQVYEESNITTIDSTSLNSPEENDNSSGYNIIFNHRFYYHLFIVIILAVLF